MNGKLVYDVQADSQAVMDNEKVEISLKEGLNRILVKVDQNIGGWGFYLRII